MRKAIAAFGVLATLLLFTGFSHVAAAGDRVIYSSIPHDLPGNVFSQGFECCSASEFGDHIQFVAGSDRHLDGVTVVMSSWGCQTGAWFSKDCSTTPGTSFSVPISLNIYRVAGPSGAPAAGALIATKTKTFNIPYRPSADTTRCTGTSAGEWYSRDDNTCYNGLATKVTFEFAGADVNLPDQVIWGIAFNTTHYGYHPVGESAPCFHSAGGCGYDSLNVGAQSFSHLVGTDVEPDGVFLNSSDPGQYCSGAPGTFRFDSPCWTGFRPMAEFTAKGEHGDDHGQEANTGDDHGDSGSGGGSHGDDNHGGHGHHGR